MEQNYDPVKAIKEPWENQIQCRQYLTSKNEEVTNMNIKRGKSETGTR